MPRPAGLSEATRAAVFILASAADAGFSFRIAGKGRLEITGPPGLADELCQPIINAIRVHGAEILRLVCWLDAEEAQGRFWPPRAGPETRQ